MHFQVICFGEISCVKNSSLPMSLESAGSGDGFHPSPPTFLPWLPPKQVQGLLFSQCPLCPLSRKKCFFGFWMSWNIKRVREVIQGHFQIMDNIIHAGHIQRELMAERQMSLPDNSRKVERMALSFVGLSAYGTSMGWPAYIWPLSSWIAPEHQWLWKLSSLLKSWEHGPFGASLVLKQ